MRKWRIAAAMVVVLAAATALRGEDSRLVERRPCGPNSVKGPLRFLFPQGFGRVDFRPACRGHDQCYLDRSVAQKPCDDRFRTEMMAACDGALFKRGCRRRAEIMYQLVRRFGASAKKT